MSVQDSDKPSPNGSPDPAAPKPLVSSALAFLHPEGFTPVGFLIIAIDKQGQPFTNSPPDPALGLHLSTIGMQYVTREVLRALQPKSPIVQVPGGALPPWRGPEGIG